MSETREIFVESVSEAGDFAGVFEHDGESAYFYLYRIDESGGKVLNAIRLFTGRATMREHEIRIQWDALDELVGLFIRGRLWAVFERSSGTKFGGNYDGDAVPAIPESVVRRFSSSPS